MNRLLLFVAIFLCFFTPLQGKNHVHNPSCLFQPHPSGIRAINPPHATKSHLLHREGIRGRTRRGKRLTAAIIDTGFHSESIRALQQKGLIHPAVYKNKYIGYEVSYAHGSGVMEALHLMAPEAQLLPLDSSYLFSYRPGRTPDQNVADGTHRAICEAIKLKVDVINLSAHLDFAFFDRKCFDAFKHAINQGIAVVFAAGNDSHQIYKYRLRDWWDEKKGQYGKNSKRQQFFAEMRGSGLLFVGSLGYEASGVERLSDFSQIAETDTNHRFLLAPGEHLPIRTDRNPHKLTRGTSFSAPVVAGGYLLLKQYMLDKRYPYGSVNVLLNILHKSGNDYFFSQAGSREEKFKSLNLHKAIRLADQMFATLPRLPEEPTEMGVSKKESVFQKLIPQRVTFKKPTMITRPSFQRAAPIKQEMIKTQSLSKKPTVLKKSFSRPAIAKKPAISSLLKSIAKKPVARPAIAKKPITKKSIFSPAKKPLAKKLAALPAIVKRQIAKKVPHTPAIGKRLPPKKALPWLGVPKKQGIKRRFG